MKARDPLTSAWMLLKVTFGRFGRHHLTDWAAALTYYSILSIFPALVVFTSILGLIGQPATAGLVDNFRGMTPGPVRDLLIAAIENVQGHSATAGAALAISLVVALYSASSYIGAFMRASNVVWGVRERRRFYQVIPLRIGLTLLLLLMLMGIGTVVIVTGPLADVLRRGLGLGDSSLIGSGLLRWPLMLVLMAALLATLYNVATCPEDRRFRPVTAGSVLAIALWTAGSLLFTLYVANFSSYNRTFGSLAGVAIFVIWLWLSNVALLLGVELDYELHRYKREHGRPALRLR
jgi:membrane protein